MLHSEIASNLQRADRGCARKVAEEFRNENSYSIFFGIDYFSESAVDFFFFTRVPLIWAGRIDCSRVAEVHTIGSASECYRMGPGTCLWDQS